MDSLCRWQVQVSVYSARFRILDAPSVQSCCTLSISVSYHVVCCGRYRKSSETCSRVIIRPELVSTSDAFMRRHTSHPAGPLSDLPQIR